MQFIHTKHNTMHIHNTFFHPMPKKNAALHTDSPRSLRPVSPAALLLNSKFIKN